LPADIAATFGDSLVVSEVWARRTARRLVERGLPADVGRRPGHRSRRYVRVTAEGARAYRAALSTPTTDPNRARVLVACLRDKPAAAVAVIDSYVHEVTAWAVETRGRLAGVVA
jgi:DNA-binding MarR family transcriptional regulator